MKLRYFFDAGSGVCLWAGDEEARTRYDYPIDVVDLPISDALRAEGERLIESWNTAIDWDNPGGPSPWTESQRAEFLRASDAFYAALSSDLGSEFEVLNEVRG